MRSEISTYHRIGIFCAAVAIFAAHVVSASSQDFSPNAVANGTVNLRSSAPTWPFYQMGEDIGDVLPGQEVRIVDERTLNFIVNRYRWLNIETTGVDGNPISGWVYDGEKDGQTYFSTMN